MAKRSVKKPAAKKIHVEMHVVEKIVWTGISVFGDGTIELVFIGDRKGVIVRTPKNFIEDFEKTIPKIKATIASLPPAKRSSKKSAKKKAKKTRP